MLRPDSTLVLYSIGLLMLAAAVMITRRRWRWLWLVAGMALCWLSSLPHGI